VRPAERSVGVHVFNDLTAGDGEEVAEGDAESERKWWRGNCCIEHPR
jgi:hypothetical protein